MAMTIEELKTMIGEIVGKSFADQWEEHSAKTREQNAKEIGKYGQLILGQGGASPAPAEKAMKFARFARALAAGSGNRQSAAEFAKEKWKDIAISAALQESTLEDGGVLVIPEISRDVIDILRATAVVRSLGARSVPMNNGTFSIPFKKTSTTANYVGENQAATTSAPTTGMLTLTAKKLVTVTPVSNDLLSDADIDADVFVRDDIVENMRVKEDVTFLRSDGTQNTPKGMRYWAPSGNVFARTQAGSASTLAEVVADLGKMVRLVQEANVPMTKPGYVFSPRTYWFLMTLLDSNGNFVFKDELMRGTLFTFPFRSTTSIPNNLGSGTDESEVMFADFNSLIIGETKAITISAYEGGAYQEGGAVVSGISTDQTVIKGTARHDFGARYRGAEISVLTTVDWGA